MHRMPARQKKGPSSQVRHEREPHGAGRNRRVRTVSDGVQSPPDSRCHPSGSIPAPRLRSNGLLPLALLFLLGLLPVLTACSRPEADAAARRQAARQAADLFMKRIEARVPPGAAPQLALPPVYLDPDRRLHAALQQAAVDAAGRMKWQVVPMPASDEKRAMMEAIKAFWDGPYDPTKATEIDSLARASHLILARRLEDGGFGRWWRVVIEGRLVDLRRGVLLAQAEVAARAPRWSRAPLLAVLGLATVLLLAGLAWVSGLGWFTHEPVKQSLLWVTGIGLWALALWYLVRCGFC